MKYFQELRLEPEDGADESTAYEDGSPDYFSPGKGRWRLLGYAFLRFRYICIVIKVFHTFMRSGNF